MSQKEDILEQIVEEYLIHRGYFVQRNIKYRPDTADPDYQSKKDSVHSDIDVLAFNPCKKGHKRVLVFNIKSYQSGFDFFLAKPADPDLIFRLLPQTPGSTSPEKP